MFSKDRTPKHGHPNSPDARFSLQDYDNSLRSAPAGRFSGRGTRIETKGEVAGRYGMLRLSGIRLLEAQGQKDEAGLGYFSSMLGAIKLDDTVSAFIFARGAQRCNFDLSRVTDSDTANPETVIYSTAHTIAADSDLREVLGAQLYLLHAPTPIEVQVSRKEVALYEVGPFNDPYASRRVGIMLGRIAAQAQSSNDY